MPQLLVPAPDTNTPVSPLSSPSPPRPAGAASPERVPRRSVSTPHRGRGAHLKQVVSSPVGFRQGYRVVAILFSEQTSLQGREWDY